MYLISECKKDILVLWDNYKYVGLNPNVKRFLKNFVANKKLGVEEQGTHLGFISFSKDNRTRELLKLGEIKNKTKLIEWLESFDNRQNSRSNTTIIKKAHWLAINVS